MKLLVIRFSSFGDIVQALPALATIKKQQPAARMDWLVRSDFAPLLAHHPLLTHVFSFDRKAGFGGLLQMILRLHQERYTHIYDAHNNVRSWIVSSLLWFFAVLSGRSVSVSRRPKNRIKRFLFFKLRKPVFPQPFRGAYSFLEPLLKWGMAPVMEKAPHLFVEKYINRRLFPGYIVLAPSAAWPTKRWPLEHWKSLIVKMPQSRFVVLGGPQDTFCAELEELASDRVVNLAGDCTLAESCAIVGASLLTISADTGILHAADQLGTPNIGMIGPTAFGYTSQAQSRILEVELYCKPCSKDGRDPCINPVFQKCMKDILPEVVADEALKILRNVPS